MYLVLPHFLPNSTSFTASYSPSPIFLCPYNSCRLICVLTIHFIQEHIQETRMMMIETFQQLQQREEGNFIEHFVAFSVQAAP